MTIPTPKPSWSDLERVWHRLSIQDPWVDDVRLPEPVAGTGIFVNAAPAAPTDIINLYVAGVVDVAGTVTPLNYASLFNPLGSGRIVIPVQINVGKYATGGGSSTSLKIQAITAASAGTLFTSAEIYKFDNLKPDSVAEFRVNNPTVTLLPKVLLGLAPPVGTGGGTTSAEVVGGTPAGPVVLRPGEGLVARIETGSTTHFWSLTQAWGEVAL